MADEGVTYVTARDLATIARATIEHHPKLYKEFYGLPSFTWGKTLGSGQDITQANRNPILGHVPGADGLKTGHTDEAGYGFTGSAEQNGRRLIEVLAGMSSWNQQVQESTRLIEWGFNAWNDKPLFKAGAKVGVAKVQMGSSSEVELVAPHDLAVTMPAGLASGSTSMKIRYDGPLMAPIAKGQEVAQLVVTTSDTPPQIVPLAAGDDVGRPDSSGASGSASSRCSGWRERHRDSAGRFISLEGGEGVGKSTQVRALAQALQARRIDVLVTREPGGSDGAETIRRLLLDEDEKWDAEAEALLFAAARADHVQKTIAPALEAGRWVLSDRFVDSSLAYQGGAGGLGIETVRAINAFAIGAHFPDRTLVLMLDEGAERAEARDWAEAIGSAAAARTIITKSTWRSG